MLVTRTNAMAVEAGDHWVEMKKSGLDLDFLSCRLENIPIIL
jgi:hypothetical protein